MSELVYVKGDATSPLGDGTRIIAHVCNDIGGWGKGFVVAVSRRWAKPEAEYRAWHSSGEGFALGAIQVVQVEPAIWVANMLGQRGIKRDKAGPPIRYDAIEACLGALATRATSLRASVHMPRIGCGLAGGEWPKIQPLIEKQLVAQGVRVTVYDFE